MWRRLACALVTVALAGCALVADLGTDYSHSADDADADAPDGAPNDVVPPEASSGTDAAPVDAGADTLADSADAYVKPDTGGDPTCGVLGHHDFCDNFDVGQFAVTWDKLTG